MTMAASPHPLLATVLTVWIIAADAAHAAGPEIDNANAFERCRAISNSAARLRCYENATSDRIQPAKPGSGITGGWRLVRTPNPRGGADAVSINHPADGLRSDLDLAGLTVRCAETDVEVLIILIQPLPPRAHPQVTVSAGRSNDRFEATVIPPGSAILLPRPATALLHGAWQSLPELAVEVVYSERAIRGVLPLSGLRSALENLVRNCPSR